MEFFEVLESRRSVRRFQERPIPEELLRRILEAARNAPSGGNMQPWELVVVRERDAIRRIVETTFTGFDPSSGKRQVWLAGAPVSVVACADVKRSASRYGAMGNDVAVLDTAAAVQNMLLAAVAVGLGSCWVGGFDPVALARVLALPDTVKPLAIVPLGYPAAVPGAPPRFVLEDFVHWERFGQVERVPRDKADRGN
jgi:nitroreductase